MFDNPEIMRQLVAGRMDQRRRQAAARRLGAPVRRRHHRRLQLRMVRPTWSVRRRPPVCAPDHAPA